MCINFRSFENYKESEWLSMEKEKFEEKFNELENSLDAAFGNPTNEAGMTLFSSCHSFVPGILFYGNHLISL